MENTKTTTQKCTREDKPLVSILLAAYKPNEKWFSEQLLSLDKQNYENVELLIWDDCPEDPVDESLIKHCITNFPYTLYRGEKNMGSNFAFEELTKLGQGKYFSYCDHDDIWCENKISVMVDKLEETDSPLVCSDMYVIDGEGEVLSDSISKFHKRHEFREGNGLAVGIIARNFVTGCASLVSSDIAKAALPFGTNSVHDQWLAAIAGLYGRIEFISNPLLYYRRHGANQTGLLHGISDKTTFYKERVLRLYLAVQEFAEKSKNYHLSANDEHELKSLVAWSQAKTQYFYRPSLTTFAIMFKHRRFGKQVALFEYFVPFMPSVVFNFVINQIKKGLV